MHNADGSRQVSLLPDSGTHAKRHDAGRFASHIADEGSGKRAVADGYKGGVHQQLNDLTGIRQNAFRHEQRSLQDSLRRPGKTALRDLCRNMQKNRHTVHRSRRSPLHIAVGSGLQAELPTDRGIRQRTARQTGDRSLYSNSHPGRERRPKNTARAG